MKKAKILVLMLGAVILWPCGASAIDDSQLVHEGLVNAPLAQVWAAFTTTEGLRSWMAPQVTIDLRVGGKLKTQYDPTGKVDDPTAIENEILSYEPLHMISIKVTRAPREFPFPNAIKEMWTVIYFEPQGKQMTRVKVVSLGFSQTEESKKMRAFFDRGNAYTIKQLQERFSHKANNK